MSPYYQIPKDLNKIKVLIHFMVDNSITQILKRDPATLIGEFPTRFIPKTNRTDKLMKMPKMLIKVSCFRIMRVCERKE